MGLLLNEGYDVKVSEVHGMSQRGGSVVTYVGTTIFPRIHPLWENPERRLFRYETQRKTGYAQCINHDVRCSDLPF